jgi:WD40 repeat protein
MFHMNTGCVNISLGANDAALTELNSGLFVSSDWNKNINFWNLTSGGTLVKAVSNTVNHLNLVQVGDYLVSCDSDGVFYIWSLADYTLLNIAVGVEVGITQKEYKMVSLNDTYLMTASLDGYVQVWSIPEGNCLSTFRPFESAIREFLPVTADITWVVSGEASYVLFLELDADFIFRVINRLDTYQYIYPTDICMTNNNDILLIVTASNEQNFLTSYNLATLQSMQTYTFSVPERIWTAVSYGRT